MVTKIVGQKAYPALPGLRDRLVAQNVEFTASAQAMLDGRATNDAADREALLA